MQDPRLYVFIRKSNAWAFVPLNGINMNGKETGYCLLQEWTCNGGSDKYQLFYVGYSREKANEFIQELTTATQSSTLLMKGPDIYTLFKNDERKASCILWKPAITTGLLEISFGMKYEMIDENTSFDMIIAKMKVLLKLDVEKVEIMSTMQHCIG